MDLLLYFDGLCEPINPGGIATYGVVIFENKKVLKEEFGIVGAGFRGDDVSNNVAEYTALIRGLELIIESDLSEKDITIRGDSQLVIKQLIGKYRVKAPRLIPLYNKSINLLRNFKSYKIEWIPRENNEAADVLSRKALRIFVEENFEEVSRFYGRKWAESVLNDTVLK
ncbi:MAG: ribonuclease HI [Fervidicoccaceae archaeon]